MSTTRSGAEEKAEEDRFNAAADARVKAITGK